MTKIFIDIETCPAQNPAVRYAIRAGISAPAQYKKQDSIDQWMFENAESASDEKWRKTSFDGGLGHICVIGIAIDDAAPISIYHQDWLASEPEVLRELFKTIDIAVAKHPNVRPVFIGHNVIQFDLRFIFQRSVVLGIKPSVHIPFNARPWGDSSVFDTMTAWAGASATVSLDKLGSALCGKGKGDMDGSMVWDAVSQGRIDDVADYCCNDISLTRSIFKRMTFEPEPTPVYDDGIPF